MTCSRVDIPSERVVGAAQQALPEAGYHDHLFGDGESVWMGGNGILVRLDASSGRILERTRLDGRSVSGLLAGDRALWLTLTDGENPFFEVVRLDRDSGRETAVGAGGFLAVPVAATASAVWTLGSDASVMQVRAGRDPETIGVGLQAGYPVEHEGRLWIPTRGERTVVVVDPATMEIETALNLDAEPWRVIEGDGSIWVLTENRARSTASTRQHAACSDVPWPLRRTRSSCGSAADRCGSTIRRVRHSCDWGRQRLRPRRVRTSRQATCFAMARYRPTRVCA